MNLCERIHSSRYCFDLAETYVLVVRLLRVGGGGGGGGGYFIFLFHNFLNIPYSYIFLTILTIKRVKRRGKKYYLFLENEHNHIIVELKSIATRTAYISI